MPSQEDFFFNLIFSRKQKNIKNVRVTTVSLVLFYPNYDPFKNIFYNLKSRYCLPLQKLVNHQIKLETKYWSSILSQRGKYFNAILLGHNFAYILSYISYFQMLIII